MGHVKNMVKHFHKVNKHKFYVFLFCCKAGIPIRGLFHDLSKYSPAEFFESVKYYNGTSSPIDECKKRMGYSLAWLHHKGRNRHHYEYWYDEIDAGGKPIKMPYKDALEMICDYLGAGKAYNGKDFSYEKEWEWWTNKKKTAKMHLFTIMFVDRVMYELKQSNNPNILKSAKYFYNDMFQVYVGFIHAQGIEKLSNLENMFRHLDVWGGGYKNGYWGDSRGYVKF